MSPPCLLSSHGLLAQHSSFDDVLQTSLFHGLESVYSMLVCPICSGTSLLEALVAMRPAGSLAVARAAASRPPRKFSWFGLGRTCYCRPPVPQPLRPGL
jgi:hypothetical protein